MYLSRSDKIYIKQKLEQENPKDWEYSLSIKSNITLVYSLLELPKEDFREFFIRDTDYSKHLATWNKIKFMRFKLHSKTPVKTSFEQVFNINDYNQTHKLIQTAKVLQSITDEKGYLIEFRIGCELRYGKMRLCKLK